MRITLLLTGKTELDYLLKGSEVYIKRIKRYIGFEVITIPDIKNSKNLTIEQYKQKEAENQIKYLQNKDCIILLDEFGDQYTSAEFARFIENKMLTSIKNIVFVIGGAFGFAPEIIKMSQHRISLSKLTFPHQMVRLIFLEQLYRAYTIIHKEKYHHS